MAGQVISCSGLNHDLQFSKYINLYTNIHNVYVIIIIDSCCYGVGMSILSIVIGVASVPNSCRHYNNYTEGKKTWYK